MKNEKIKIVVLRPQARLGAQPPKAALRPEIERPPYNTKQTPHNP